MKEINLNKYYRVYKNDTTVTEVSANDFKTSKLSHLKKEEPVRPSDKDLSILPRVYFLPADKDMYYGYYNKVKAMEMAKAGALKHIGLLIKEAEQGIYKLKQYRNDHYDDLNNSLLDANIRRLEKEFNNKQKHE
jgi:hypothetical protein